MKLPILAILGTLLISFTAGANDIESVHQARIKSIRSAAEAQKMKDLIDSVRLGEIEHSKKLSNLKDQFIKDVSRELNSSLAKIESIKETNRIKDGVTSIGFYTSFSNGVTCSNAIIINEYDVRGYSYESSGHANCTDGKIEFNFIKDYPRVN